MNDQNRTLNLETAANSVVCWLDERTKKGQGHSCPGFNIALSCGQKCPHSVA